MKYISLAILLATTSCSNYMTALKDGRYENNMALREMSFEIEELKTSLQQAHIEITALEDRLQSQEKEMLENQGGIHTSNQIAALETRIDELKAAQKTTLAELNSLHSHASKTSSSLNGYRNKINTLEHRLSEVVDLKKTLTSISTAIQPCAQGGTYEVVSGDTLGKIAGQRHTTVEAIKTANNLQSNRIIIGQKLIIPN